MYRARIISLAAALTVSIVGAAAAAAAPGAPSAPLGAGQDLAPAPVVHAPTRAAASARPGGGSGISYHGGPIVLGTTKLYAIWYGDWSGSTTPTILGALMTGLGGSPYYNINTTYYDGSKRAVTNAVALAGSTTDAYSQGTALSDAQIEAVVSSAITSGRLAKDANGVYVVLTSQDVTATSGFLTAYCGWHTYGTVQAATIKYAFVGDASANLSACAAQTTSSPNDNPAADAMASVLAHEIVEAVTDPQLNAWYDTRGFENADKCAWKFGTTYTVANGSKANMQLGGRDFLIQQNWVNAGKGGCVLAF